MSILEDAFKGGNIVTGLAIGIGAAVLAPLVIPVVRPVAKSVLKGGLVAYDQGRVMLAELNKQVEDTVTEVRSEMDNGQDRSEKTLVARREGSRKKPEGQGFGAKAERA